MGTHRPVINNLGTNNKTEKEMKTGPEEGKYTDNNTTPKSMVKLSIKPSIDQSTDGIN